MNIRLIFCLYKVCNNVTEILKVKNKMQIKPNKKSLVYFKNRIRISKSNKKSLVYFEIVTSVPLSNTKLNVYKKVLQEV